MHHDLHPRRLLTPVMRDVIDRMARTGRPPLPAMGVAAARAFYEAGAGVLDLTPAAMARVEAVAIPARDGASLPAQLFLPIEPAEAPGGRLGALLFFHGGGFTIGSVATHASVCRHLARLSQVAVLSVDYRLAPEHRFPTAANDAWDSLQWLHAHAAGLGLDPQRLAVGGDSAGGTLSAVTAIEARDAGLPLRLQLLFYPGCGAPSQGGSRRQFAQGFVLEDETIEWFFNNYLSTPRERQDWRFSPLMAPDLDGVAPAWIGLAECDPIVDDGLQYADRLRLAGVPVDLEVYRGVVHGFIQMGRVIPQALQAHSDAARALREACSYTGASP